MALWTLEKPPFGAIFHHFFTVFSGFFCALSHQGAKWREFSPEKRWF
jgi:hypothetical protein